MKRHTSLSIEEDILDKAKQMNINLSEVAEKAIKAKAGIIEVDIGSNEKCGFCGREMEKQTKDDLTKGLCWLWPDEIWICDTCLKTKVNEVIAGKH